MLINTEFVSSKAELLQATGNTSALDNAIDKGNAC